MVETVACSCLFLSWSKPRYSCFILMKWTLYQNHLFFCWTLEFSLPSSKLFWDSVYLSAYGGFKQCMVGSLCRVLMAVILVLWVMRLWRVLKLPECFSWRTSQEVRTPNKVKISAQIGSQLGLTKLEFEKQNLQQSSQTFSRTRMSQGIVLIDTLINRISQVV